MEYKTINEQNYNLHLIKTNKFKTVLVKVIFHNEIIKNEITSRCVLLDNLTFSCKNYNTIRKMSIKKQDLYGLSVSSNNTRIGNQIISEISISFLDPKYTEEKMFEQSMIFLSNIIFNPNVTNKKFNEKNFDKIIIQNKNSIKEQLKNPNILINQKLKESLSTTIPFSYHMSGYLEDLEKLTPEGLYQYYDKFMNNNAIDIYVAGDFDEDMVIDIIKTNFKFNSINKQQEIKKLSYETNNKCKETIEKTEFSQSSLGIAGYFENLTDHERWYIVPIFNIIYGNSPDSKLFKNVREKKSYAYSIASSFRLFDGLFTIYAGISSKNYKNCVKEIKENLLECQNKDFSDKELSNAKAIFKSVIKDFEEYLSSMIEYYFGYDYLHYESLPDIIKKIDQITKEEVSKIAKSLNLTSIYLLEEKTNERN